MIPYFAQKVKANFVTEGENFYPAKRRMGAARIIRIVPEKITGKPAPLPKGGRDVAKVICRDGSLLDTIHQVL